MTLPFEEKKKRRKWVNTIEFNENHTYKVDGVDAISVTQLLKAVGIDKGFDEDDKVLMAKVKAASEKGNYYDKLAEEAINDPFELTEWQERFLKALEEKRIGYAVCTTKIWYSKTIRISWNR